MKNLQENILKLLTEDARFTAKEIAKMLNLTEDEVAITINELEESEAIIKYSAVTNKEKLDSSYVEALVEIKIIPQKTNGYDNIARVLAGIEGIKSLYLMSGGFDFLLMVEGNNLREVALFVNEKLSVLDCVSSTTTHFVLKKYKTEGVVIEKENDKREIM